MSVFINNLDDYIAPGQACVNPLVLSRGNNESQETSTKRRILALQEDDMSDMGDMRPSKRVESIKPDLIKTKASSSSAKVASVSLNDCLACSGCITTAESVLIQEQSYSKLLTHLQQMKLNMFSSVVVVAISPQSLASIALFTSLSTVDVFLKLSAILKSLGVAYVIDMSAVGDVALMEAREEFLYRYKAGGSTKWESPPVSMAMSATSTAFQGPDGSFGNISQQAPSLSPCIPMFVSQCPGWVCYAEKTFPQAIPFISTTKSPQQIFGTLFREILFERTGIARNNIYTVSIQPCFDKKLEASRKDFYHEEEAYDEINLIISTTELWNLVEEQSTLSGFSSMSDYFHSFPMDSLQGRDDIEDMFRSYSADGHHFIMSSHSDGGSGGYIDHILRYASEKILSVNIWNQQLVYQVGRNPDYSEIEIIAETGSKLKFVKAYGFRNIQSIMQKMKRGKGCDFDFVEIMACPSGCVNGGGQIKLQGVVETPQSLKERLASISQVFHSDIQVHRPEESKVVQYIYASNRLQHPLSSKAIELLHTKYHTVPKLESIAPLAVKW